MASIRKRSPWRSRRTNTREQTQADPVVVQQKPEPEVIEAVRAMPVKPAPAPVVKKAEKPAATTLKFFTQKFIDELIKNHDLLNYYTNAKRLLQIKRSTNLPGDDERADKLAERLAELRRIVIGLGYPG